MSRYAPMNMAPVEQAPSQSPQAPTTPSHTLLPSGIFDVASLGPDVPHLAIHRPGVDTLLGKLLDSATDAIWVFDSAGQLLWCNQRASRRNGVSLASAVGRSAASLGIRVAPGNNWAQQLHYLQASGGHIERGKSGGQPATDGRVLERRSHWIAGGGGSVLVAERDATVRVRMETQLRTTAEQLEQLLATAPMALIELDTGGNILRGNGAAMADLMWVSQSATSEGKRNQQVWAWLSGQPDAELAMRICLQGQPGTTRFRYRGRGFEATLAPRRDEDGQVLGAVLVCLDVTDRMATERKAAEAFDQLRRANEELQQFAYVASHDLQEPLRTVSSFLDLLEERLSNQLTTESQEFLSFARDAVDQMRSLVGDLLRYARTVIHSRPRQNIDVRIAIDLAMADLRDAIRTTGAEFTIAEDLPHVHADQVQVRQLFAALLSNALRFRSDAAPRISIGAKVIDKMVRFEVTDNGIGIPSRFHDRIFQVFERLQVSRRDGGSGIGLALCKRIVELHEGRIGLESEVGSGSTFWFTLQPAESANPNTRGDMDLRGA
jgi:signal transduction histidine kinase